VRENEIVPALYTLGSWGYIVFAGTKLWPMNGFFDWLTLMIPHAFLAVAWPIGALLWYVGYFH